MKIDLKNDFNNKILERGYEYYENGLVENVVIKDNIVTAKVIGTTTYNVSVEVDNGVFINGDCTCPYASEGNYCKHMAALLYKLNEEDIDKDNNYSTKNQQTRNIIANINKEQLDEFLVELLSEDKNVYDKFRLKFYKLFPKPTMNDYKKKIYDAIKKSAGRDGFIDYHESREYTKNMYKITSEVNTLVDNEEYNLAFDVVKIILESIPNTDIDDSNGSTGEVAYSCIEIMERILEYILHDENSVAKKILDYILNETKEEKLSNYGIDLYPLLQFYIDRNMYLNEIEKGLLEALEAGNNKEYFWNIGNYIDTLISIYVKENAKEKMIKLLKTYSKEKSVCLKLVEEYLKQDDVINAINLLNIRLKNTNDKTYALKLADIYQKENMIQEYKETLYKLLYELDKYDIDIYKRIKSLYSKKDWLAERKNIIDRVSKEKNSYWYVNDLLKIYIEEKMYDDIYNIIKDKDMDTIISYEQYLLPKYNKELLNIYVKYCYSFANKASDRKMYSELARKILHIKQMKNSKNEYTKLLEGLQEKYRKKTAMQDELSKIL